MVFYPQAYYARLFQNTSERVGDDQKQACGERDIDQSFNRGADRAPCPET